MDPLALALTPGIGPKRLLDLLQSEDPLEALKAEHRLFAAWRNGMEERAKRERERAKALGARILGLWDEDFPQSLRILPQPPTHVYVKGELPEEGVALVGARRASPWARAFTRGLARALAEAGAWVVSGLARGIDAEAHLGALEAGGRTLGVLGSGLDRIYPPEHQHLASRMDLLSEFPFGTGPRPEFFPRRNRLIAALAKAVVVVEAGEESGALITARHALELGKEVLAVPGRPTDKNSQGANRLIQDGAYPVLSPEDLLDYLRLSGAQRPKPSLSQEEAVLYEALRSLGQALPEELALRTGLAASEVLALLTALELKGLAQTLPGGRYAAL
ncbi:MAG: DNA-protecting protein DprA [Thermus sp.]|uniref:DNA-processing protein DprA n=1 Tax=Thermus sp. TaxID=275 RepID=UPI00332936AF